MAWAHARMPEERLYWQTSELMVPSAQYRDGADAIQWRDCPYLVSGFVEGEQPFLQALDPPGPVLL